jgi:uncharacterized protein YjiS (DUF1127 family)
MKMRQSSSILMQRIDCITKTDDWRFAMSTHSLAALWSVALRPARFLRDLRQMLAVAQSRRALRRLDDHLLRDIGLTRHEAESEATRAPWDAPSHWRR